MEKKHTPDYFTAGELANMFRISKQTLLYYDKIKLLSPDYIGTNGYRHYSIQQYLDLEIITNLRSLNFSIADINNYMQHKGKAELLQLLQKRDAECQAIITENQKIRKSLQHITQQFVEAEPYILGQITLSCQRERLLQLSVLAENTPDKDRVVRFAKHSQFTFHNKDSLEKGVGWVIDADEFLQQQTALSKAFFSFAPDIPHHVHKPKFHLQEGLYLETYVAGTFYKSAQQEAKKILAFLCDNNLQPDSAVFILPLENHWFHETSEKYINKVFMRVKPCKQ